MVTVFINNLCSSNGSNNSSSGGGSSSSSSHRRRNDFSVGKQKLVKNNQDNQIQVQLCAKSRKRV